MGAWRNALLIARSATFDDQQLGISPMAQLALHTAKSTEKFLAWAVSAIFTINVLPRSCSLYLSGASLESPLHIFGR
jgi:hypothetical protein